MTDDDLLNIAATMIADGRFDKAIKLLAPCRHPDRYRLLGQAFLGRRHAEPALSHLRCAAALDPGDPQALLALARAHLAALDAGRAVTLMRALRQRADDLPGLTDSLASAYRRDALYEEAVALADSEASPSPSLLYERALSLLHLGQAEAALTGFDGLLRRSPTHAAGWFWSHAPALDLIGWDDAERRLIAAAQSPKANRKYQGFLAAYDILWGSASPRPCPPAYRHLAEAAELLRGKMTHATRLFGVHATLLRWSLRAASQSGLVLEFGVRRGTSIRMLAAATDAPLHGFDSFEGLPESWVKAPAGMLSTQGALPSVPANVTLHRGWFDQTLPDFLARHPEPLRLANIDSDIYASARTVLWALADRLRPDSVLLFDELIGNRSWRQDEYRALTEFARYLGVDWQVLAINLAGKQVAVRMMV